MLLACSGSKGSGPSPAPSNSPNDGMELPVAGRARFFAADAGDQAGTVAAGDFNGDGIRDVVLGAAFADGPDNQRPDAGEAYVFLGPIKPGGDYDAAQGAQALTVYGAAGGDQAARGLAAGDVNGDGIDDLIIGSPFSDGPAGDRADAGRIDVVFGSAAIGSAVRTADLATTAGVTVWGASAGDLAGIAVAAANLNGDPARDLIVGAFWADGPDDARSMAGEIYAIYGSPAGPRQVDLAKGEEDVLVYGAAAQDRLGEGVAAADINGDGLDDLILPAPFAPGLNGQADTGRTTILQSPAPRVTDLANAAPGPVIYGVDDGDQLGHVVAAGDVDGDKRADLLLTAVSADGPDNTVNLAGEAVLVRASSLKPKVDVASGGADAIIYGRDREDRLGRSAAVGDLDGDGRPELLLGAPGGAAAGNRKPTAGELYVLEASGLKREQQLPTGSVVYYGEDPGDNLASEVFGRSPLLASDLDGDGRAEIVVAAPLGDGPDNSRRDSGEAYVLFVKGPIGG